MEDSNAVIWTRNLDVYQKNVKILSDVNLEIAQGDFVYLIGKTGTGKSSLLRTFYADIPVVSGQASVAGYDLARLRTRDIPYLRRKLGIEIHSGKNRIVRRLFESQGYTVKALDRVYFAGLTKKGLKKGDWRFLTESEVNILKMGAYV